MAWFGQGRDARYCFANFSFRNAPITLLFIFKLFKLSKSHGSISVSLFFPFPSAAPPTRQVFTWGMSRFGQCGRPASQLKRLVVAPSIANRFHYKLEFMPPGPIALPADVAASVCRVEAGFYQTAIITSCV